MSRPRSWGAYAVALSALLALGAYANSLDNGFAYDDVHIVEENQAIRSLGNLPELLSAPYWPERRGGASLFLYRPVTLLTMAVDWSLWDGGAFGFHLTNVLLHALATAGLALLLLRLAGPGAAAVGGILFAWHPVHTEAVANVVGRAEILAALFLFAALLVAWPRRDDPEGERTTLARASAAGLLYLLAILSKESAIVLPLLIALVDAVRERWTRWVDLRAHLQRRARLYAALFFAALVAFVLRWEVLGDPIGGDRPPTLGHDPDYATRFFTMIRVWPEYLRLLLAPFELSADYSPAVILPADSWTPLGWLGVLLALVLIGLGAALWKRAPVVSGGVAWVPIALLPVSNLLIVSGVLLAERTLYLPSAGVSLLAAGLVPYAMRLPRRRRLAVAAAGLALAAAFGARTVSRNPAWESTRTVFDEVLRTRPASYKAQWALAYRLATRGLLDQAEAQYRYAIELWPNDDRLWGDLAAFYVGRSQWEKAAEAARRARELNPQAPSPHHFLALSLVSQERWRDGVIAAHRGLAALGDDALLYNLLSRAREGLGEYRLAADALRASLAVAPADWSAWYYVARLYRLGGAPGAARAAVDSAAVLTGDSAAHAAIAALRDSLSAHP